MVISLTMTLIHLGFVILVSCGRLIVGISESHYLQTKVSTETDACLNIWKNKNVEELMNVKSLIKCSLLCTNHPDCRRFMYDRLLHICTLFYSGENCVTLTGTVEQSLCFKQKHICNEEKCTRCPIGYHGDRCEFIIKDCIDGMQKPINRTRKKVLTYIEPKPGLILEVFCRFENGGKTLVTYVNVKCNAVDFNRPWLEYRNGFGHNTGNYWLGLRNMYALLQAYPQMKLTFFLEDEDYYQSSFDHFSLTQVYFNISLGGFKSSKPPHDLGNFLHSHNINGQPFSTYDQDFSDGCPEKQKYGWWFPKNPLCSGIKITDDEIVWMDGNNVLRNYTEFNIRLEKKI